MREKLGIILCVLIVLSNPTSLLAQQAASSSAAVRTQTSASQTKKDVVRNFKINLSEYSSFGSDCSQKQKGDANCDTNINDFDLSIWEIEFNSTNSPRRSDFNNDGIVNLLDYGIWRNTIYPQAASLLPSVILNLIQDPEKTAWIPDQVRNDILDFNRKGAELITQPSSFITVIAQESSSGGGEVNSSSTFTSESGNSLVVNSISGGNTQQINFDQSGNPQTSSFYDGNGQSYAEVAFTNSGNTIIATQENGIPITISKTASGPIIENFRNPDGSPLAIKSWPSQQSYDSNQPPIAVTIPGPGATKEVLNMQPNGDGIVEKLDAGGNILTRTQLRANGTIVTEDLGSYLTVQSNSEAKFTNLSMKNNIGGDTQYMFYDGALYAIVQTASETQAYVSKPLDSTGSSWSYESLVEGVKREEKTVANPITEAKSNTPDPQSLIQYINYYKQSSLATDAITFSDGFSSTTSSLSNIINKANSTLAISQTQAPSVLGLSIVKEAFAQQSGWTQISSDPTIGEGKYSGPNGTEAVVSVRGAGGNGTADIKVDVWSGGAIIDSYTFEGNRTSFESLGFTPGPNGTSQPGRVSETASLGGLIDTARQPGSSVTVTNNITGQTGATAIASTLPGVTQTAPAPPAPPAPPGPPQPAPGTGLGESDAALDAGAKAAQAAGARGESPAQQAKAGYDAAYAKTQEYAGFGQEKAQNLANDVFSHSFFTASLKEKGVDDAALQNITGRDLAQMAAERGISITQLNTARSEQGLPTISSPFSAQSGQSGPAGTPASAPTAAAAVAPGIATPQSGFIGNTGVYSQVTQNLGNGTFISEIKSGGPEGATIATQTHNPAAGTSTWTDDRGTTFTQGGAVTGYTPNTNTYAPSGTTYALDTAGNIVAVGYGTPVDANGRVAEGRSISGAELGFARDQLSRQDTETANTTGARTGTDFANANSTCFLPGTLISTPTGPTPIETLAPGDKVFSYNEKTGAKQISDFTELDINFVDEYLIINNQIKTTIYHPFYTVIPHLMRDPENTAWAASVGMTKLKTIRADALQIGDIMQNESGKRIPVYSIEKVVAPKSTVYNLMNVSPNNNFFAESILVHNYDWSPPSMDADPNQTGASPDDPGSFFSENLSHPDTARGGGGGGNDYSADNPISGGEIGGNVGGDSGGSSNLGKSDSGGSDGWGQSDTQQDTQQQQDTSQSDANSGGADSSQW